MTLFGNKKHDKTRPTERKNPKPTILIKQQSQLNNNVTKQSALLCWGRKYLEGYWRKT